MKVKRMGIKEIFSRIWVISANKIKTSESISKESSQLKLNSSLRQIFAAMHSQVTVSQPHLSTP